ncbi:hypothetical protein EKO04_007343 [Ascochyta lentis]|uniref:Uncharacterized protein n=1 Tax=Ascochyta lentis TaxID=205686 RepID=A0A8H7MIL0_9PLEO|nr:hypothetical protein EKO04_007343 [Ascochyta lentis]
MSTQFGSPTPGEPSAAERSRRLKRRWQSRSDEEIEQLLDNRNLGYRNGWPRLPPLPVSERKEGAKNMVSKPQDVIEATQTLCQTQRLDVHQIYFAFRTPEVTIPGEHYLTLVITVDLSDDPILVPAIVQIRKLLQQDAQNQEISIEIIDYRVVHGLYTFAVPPSKEHLLRTWKPVYDHILAEIHSQHEQWLTLEMLFRGLDDDAARCPATVVITSPTAGNTIWLESILPRIRQRIYPLDPHLKVELLCGTSVHIASQGCTIDGQAYNRQVPMGSSIGQWGVPNHSGTVGGAVKLSNGKTYALSNHHVVRNDTLDRLLSVDSGESPALKPGNPALKSADHRFTCPSSQDNEAFIEELEKYENQWLSQIQAGKAASQQYLDSTRADLAMARQTDRSFGTLYASSGLRTVRAEKLSSNPFTGKLAEPTDKTKFRFMLDWSLLEMLPSRSMVNTLPMRANDSFNTGKYDKLLSGQECKQWTTMNNPKAHILRDEVSVGKFGRTTAFAYGYINAIPTVINPASGGSQFQFIAKAYGFTVEESGFSLSMIAHHGAAVSLGDSGSVVLHAPSGDWLGLLFGETRTKAALITPIDLVFRDIKDITGLDVVEPVFNPN